MNQFLEPYRKYADFNGRARRREYWLFVAFLTGVLVVGWSLAALGELLQFDLLQYGAELIAVVILLGSWLPMLALHVRRLHDTNRSGWWILIGVIPFLGALLLLLFDVLDGMPGDNRFGANPKGWSGTPAEVI